MMFAAGMRWRAVARAGAPLRACHHSTFVHHERPPMLPVTEKLVEGVLDGNRTALSRAITLVESSLKRDEEQAELLLDAVLTRRRSMFMEQRKSQSEFQGLPTFRLGIAGPPGAGKSTFIETLGLNLTAQGHRVAVLAIDPSSSRSGGSILGDKTRMTYLSNDPRAFVRPSPSRGTLGGVAQHTNDIVLLCEAAGHDIILVESVGLGQSEIVIDDTVDMVMLLVPPAGGDELQGSKKGIMEIADVVVVNKADGELKSAAKHTAVDYMHALQLLRRKDPDWEPKVKMCSAAENQGIEGVWGVVCDYRTSMNEFNKIAQKRNLQGSKWMWNQLNEQLMRAVSRDSRVKEQAERMKQDLVRGFISPRSAAAQVLDLFLTSQSKS